MNTHNHRNRSIWLAPVVVATVLFGTLLLVLPVQPAQAGSSYPCAATPNDGVTVYTSNDASAVQQAASAVGDGGVVKVAGYCSGVQVSYGTTQTVLLTKTMTLQGGYTNTQWTIAYPLTQPTFLDALGGGRTLIDLTIQNGNLITNSGAGIYAMGQLTLTNVDILSNTITAITNSDGGGGCG
ncbi:MAG: hypothetical protein IPK16_20775 [Anaerolineales bacterium]|nr:hypothetical protein [Anaerolineales bacterium]